MMPIGLMRLTSRMGLMGLIGLIGLIGLWGCSSDDETAPEMPSLEVNGYVAGFEEANETNRANRANEAYGADRTTRAWVPPTGYSYSSELANKPISVFFTQNAVDPADGYDEEFFFKSSDKWRVSKEPMNAGTYYLYGYIPHIDYVTPKISHLVVDEVTKNYDKGAVLTLENLPTVTESDLCVIIGAKNGKDDYKANEDYTVTGLVPGTFEYEAQTATKESHGGNYVYLLFDHLYSAMGSK